MYRFPSSAQADPSSPRPRSADRPSVRSVVRDEIRAARELSRARPDTLPFGRLDHLDAALDAVADRVLDAIESLDAHPPQPDPRATGTRVPGRHRARAGGTHQLRLAGQGP